MKLIVIAIVIIFILILAYPLFPNLSRRVLDPLGQRGRTEPGVPVLGCDVAGVLVVLLLPEGVLLVPVVALEEDGVLDVAVGSLDVD